MRVTKTALLFLITITLLAQSSLKSQETGKYFSKKSYVPAALPTYEINKHLLPKPILQQNSEWIEMYWKCWEIAFRGFKSPSEGSPLVSNWIDEAFSENIFQWDTIFMIMFARYAHNIFPAIESLDNFYALQRESGFLGREFREKDGKIIHFDFDGGLFSDKGWKNAINPPLFSWAEVESYKLTGDKERLKMVLPALEKYAEWLNRDGDPSAADWENNGRISKGTAHSLYWNTPLGSGMDNTPRPAEKGAGWVEMSSQMVIMYNNLAVICDEIDKPGKADFFRSQAESIGNRINKWCWNDGDGFYYDVLADGKQFHKKTIGGFWPLLAGIATKQQAEKLITHLKNKNEFWRLIVFPSLSADEKEYQEYGGYWQGGVWAPTNVMVIKGLENYGYYELAGEAAEKYLTGIYEVYKDSNTVYENYAPDHYAPGRPSKDDFVGWTGCGPIQLLFENVIGLENSGTNNNITWRLRRTDRHGVEGLTLGENIISVICEERENINSPAMISVNCKNPFYLKVIHNGSENEFKLSEGNTTLEIK